MFKLKLKLPLPCKLCHSTIAVMPQQLCQDCWQQLPWFNQSIQYEHFQLYVACWYQYPINRLIQQFKYEQQLHWLPVLSELLLTLKIIKIQAIVAMPVSEQRLTDRGYNQALLLAQVLSKQLQVPIWQPISRKNEHSQKGLSGAERRQNIEQQFYVTQKTKQRFRRVLMVDDVITTGSSLDALAKQLKLLGCQEIFAACIAIAK
ncbi:ComF family protein [Acinetobacter sp. MD2]|uniref:ComF family protein n=1 Tax=Acinetobacter sp. MD2 TaxID=2600066 RepID=UPI003B63E72E